MGPRIRQAHHRRLHHPRPPEALDGTELELEGQTLRAVSVGQGDCENSTVLHVPAAYAVIGGDIVYNGVHMMTAETDQAKRNAWIASLDTMPASTRNSSWPGTSTSAPPAPQMRSARLGRGRHHDARLRRGRRSLKSPKIGQGTRPRRFYTVAEDARFELARRCHQDAFQHCGPTFTHGWHCSRPARTLSARLLANESWTRVNGTESETRSAAEDRAAYVRRILVNAARTGWRRRWRVESLSGMMIREAEDAGFEPARGCPQHAFQVCCHTFKAA